MVKCHEILCSLTRHDDFILGLVEFQSGRVHRVRHERRPFRREPAFDVKRVSYGFAGLLVRAGGPP